ncbi:MAG: Flp pilus assembly protein CpaB [Thermodesulfobacteriota bacterium]
MKNKANLVLITMTLFSALLAVCLVYIYVNTKISNAHQEIEQKYATLADEHEFCNVVVCAADIAAGTVIEKDDLMVLKINEQTICDANKISDPGQIINRKAQYKIYKGEWIVPERLYNISKVSSVMAKDKRAFRLWLDQTRGLIGLIEPGSMVDVLAVLPGESGQQKVSKIVLQNIRVLAVANRLIKNSPATENMPDDSRKQKEKQSKTPKVTTITLEVTPEQALDLALVMETGKIHLALRDGTNQKIVESSSVLTLDTLLQKTEEASIE